MMKIVLFVFVLIVVGISAQNITVKWTGGWNCMLSFLGKSYQCSLGKNGVSNEKQEGDGKTPLGSFPLRRAFYRRDKNTDINLNCYNISPSLSCEVTQVNYGWVDDASDPLYNQFVYLPYHASHEELYLKDSNAYDLMAVIGYNDDPVIPFAGSAIFFHVASSDYGPTAGCVALTLDDLRAVLSNVTNSTLMIIEE